MRFQVTRSGAAALAINVALSAGVAYNEDGHAQAGMGVDAGDYDGDGWLDIVKTNFSDDSSTLYRNNQDARTVR